MGLWFGLALLAACTKAPEPVEGPTSKLSSIDSLMWQQPDSALQALMAYEGDASEYNNHYAKLLTSELLYKNDYEQTNRRELQQAVAYFDSLLVMADGVDTRGRTDTRGGADTRGVSLQGGGRRDARRASAKTTAFLAARAHYINGVGYYERDSVIEACREYLKALEVMEGHFEEKELVGEKARFMALTYTHLAGLYSDLYLHEQAIYFGKTALVYYSKFDAPSWNVAWILNEIGSHFDIMDQLDTADYYYQKSLSLLFDTTSLIYRDVVTRIANLSFRKKKGSESSLNQLHHIIALSKSEKEYFSRCLTIGEIYYHEKQFDSALVYLNKVFRSTQSLGAKKQAAEWLVEISEVEGRPSEAHEYARFLVPFATTDETQSALKSQLTTMCQNYVLEKQKQLHQKRSNKLVMAIPVAVIVAFVVAFAIKRRSKKQMERERHAHKMQQAALTGKLRKSNEALRELKGQIQQQESEAVSKPEQANSFADEPICQLIMERVNEGQFKSQMDCTVYKDYALGKEQLMALREAADRHFNHFTSRLAQTYPSLTKNDLDYCCLYLLGLTDADISALMQRAYNTVSERSRKLKTIFDSEVALPVTIRSLANGFASV